ncbi:MAG: hypothetical protein P1V51_21255 [Deltaproteobacteria bacterium]|nr:hypothetical protein [Deltaproteobacteria bacterium]
MASAMAAKAEAEGLTHAPEPPESELPEPPDRDEPPPLGELTERPGGGGPPRASAPPAPPPPAARPAPRPEPRPEPKPEPKVEKKASEGGAPAAPRLPLGDDPGADLATRYEALVTAVMTHGYRPFLASALEHGRPIEITDEVLSLAMPRGLYLDGLGSPQNRGLLETFLADHFGRPMELRLEVQDTVKTDALPEAIATVRERELAEHVERVRGAAMENPAVKLAVEALGGQIEDIRILE